MNAARMGPLPGGAKRVADPRACEHCATVFVPKFQKRAARFCGKRCSVVHRLTPEHQRKAALAAAKVIGDRYRGTGVKGAYIKFNGRHLHRVVAEQKIGRPLRPGEIVHHIDGNRLNNDPTNLAVMSQAEHMREHGLGIPGMTLPWKPWTLRRKKAA